MNTNTSPFESCYKVCVNVSILFFTLLLSMFVSITASSEEAVSETNIFGAAAIVDYSIVSGGIEDGTTLRGLFGLSLNSDLEKYTSIKGLSISINYSIKRGDEGGDFSGDIQGFSNIDAEDHTEFSEVYFEHQVNDNFKYKIGQMDANAEFSYADNAGDFINSSMGFSPTVFTLPTYPDPVLAFNAFYEISDNGGLSFGYFDGTGGESNFDDAFWVLEGHYQYQTDSTIKLGYWSHDGEFDTVEGPVESGSGDIYLIIDHTISDKYGFYVQFGNADYQISEISSHFGAGFVWKQPFKGRSDSSFGFGLSQVELGFEAGSERAIEFYYRWEWNEYLVVKPNLQFIFEPSGINDNAIVFTVRFESEI
ncbi:MAG: porin [Polaribacter sp.]|jgi:porin